MELAMALLTLGGLFLVGLAADLIGRRTAVPRVTLLLVAGVLVGHSGFGLIPEAAYGWYEGLSVVALTLVAFLLGGALERGALAAHGRHILVISAVIVVVTFGLVTAVLMALGAGLGVAVVLGAIATATAPAATIDVVRQSGIRNAFTETLEGIVAIDDAWGLIVFGLALTVAHAANGVAGSEAIEFAIWELGGGVALGIAVGVPAAFLTGRISSGEPLQAEALAIVFLTAGTALWAEVSFLIAGMTAGAIVVNLARHHERSFHEIEHFQWPFMLLFFILAGSALEIHEVFAAGLIGAGFVTARIGARIVGGWIGAAWAGTPRAHRHLYGPALLPQAGVAVGMALVAARELPHHEELILSITIASTVIFELIGPLATRWAVGRSASV